ncbi:hypothetical protein [Rhizobium sp. R693]|uniref:hypothetical protein n=1 Tax=Rhizobium sp. R693 TaxID=1764276 RepID=UPI000B52FE91|nr:hypothetical protein [Rhizobium sp. R693]OWV88970.1 hypothetical protein ATY79_29060 [Rhizobium sp. R693]
MFELMKRQWREKRLLNVIVALLCVALSVAMIVNLAETYGAHDTPRPLINNDQWRVVGDFARFADPVDGMEIPSKMTSAEGFALWRSWTPDKGGVVGVISTAPFTPPHYMAVPILGFPREVPGTRIFVRCEENGDEWDIASARTNTQWSTVYLNMRARACKSQVSLRAINSDPQYYVGIGTPFSVARGSFVAHTGFGPRALVILLTWLITASAIVLTPFLLTVSDQSIALPLGMVGLAVAGMVAFTVHMIPQEWRIYASYAIILCIAISALHLIAVGASRQKLLQIVGALLPALLVWLVVALFYSALVSAGDNGAGSWAINGFFSPLRWSTDNQLPYLFAEDLVRGETLADIKWSSWLAADRTPLLTALLLLVRETFFGPLKALFRSDFLPTAYMMASILFLTSWVPVVFWISKIARLRSAALMMILACASPFFFFNSVFAWGKMLGGVYAVLAFGLLHQLSHGRTSRYVLGLIAGCATASYLSHASNLFALVPIALYFLSTIFRTGLRPIILGAVFALLMASPWLYWLRYVQPGGNALIRYFLTGDFGFARRDASIALDVIAKYRQLGLAGWLLEKRDAVTFMFDLDADWSHFGEVQQNIQHVGFDGGSRVLDFFILARGLWLAAVAPLLGLFASVRPDGDSRSSLAFEALVIGLAGIVLSLLLSLAPSFTHHQPYGSTMLIFIFGAIAASRLPKTWRYALCLASMFYFAVVWIVMPISELNTVWVSTLSVAVGLLLLLCVACLKAGELYAEDDDRVVLVLNPEQVTNTTRFNL